MNKPEIDDILPPDCENLGARMNADVIGELLDLSGKSVLDCGCGNMGFTRQLLDQNPGQVFAIDPDPVQSELNRTTNACREIQFVECGAEQIPLPDDSLDGIFFAYSLHHVPAMAYPQMFPELFRVLRAGGFLYVIEPLACPLFEIMDLFHSETKERLAAQNGLKTHAVPRFETMRQVTYHGERSYESFEQFADIFSSKSFNHSYTAADVRRDEVREKFERLGAPDYSFQSPKLVMCLKGLKK